MNLSVAISVDRRIRFAEALRQAALELRLEHGLTRAEFHSALAVLPITLLTSKEQSAYCEKLIASYIARGQQLREHIE